MTIKISQLGNLTVVQGNTIVPVVSNITGTLTTVKSNIQQIQDYIVANGVSANITALYANITALYANAATQSDLIIRINANVTQANVGVIGYVDNSVLSANLGMKGYVDSISGSESIANVNMKGYVDGQITAANAGVTSANIGIIGYIDQANSIQSAQINAANVGIIGYIDLGNTSMKSYVDGQITAANVGVTSANIGMLGYVNNQTYSNVQTSAFFITNLPTYQGNIGVNVNVTNGTVTANSFVGNGQNLTNTGMVFLGNITIPVGTAQQYSLGNLTLTRYNQLYVTSANLRVGPNSDVSFANVIGDQTNSNQVIKGAAGVTYASFFCTIDLTNGLLQTSTAGVSNSPQSTPVALNTSSLNSGFGGPTAISRSTDTIYVYFTSAQTRVGNISIYGVR